MSAVISGGLAYDYGPVEHEQIGPARFRATRQVTAVYYVVLWRLEAGPHDLPVTRYVRSASYPPGMGMPAEDVPAFRDRVAADMATYPPAHDPRPRGTA